MRLSQRIAVLKNRGVWSNPARTVRTLESFAETEEDGGKDLRVAARRIAAPDLPTHILRHADDEVRHAQLFRNRAAELRADGAVEARDSSESDQAYDLSRGRKGTDVDAHGFFNAGLCDDLGEVAYVAMLHVAEKRAADVFEVHHELTQHDPGTAKVFAEILKDEKYHCAYTKKFLDKWEQEGRAEEVREGLSSAKNSRFIGAWKRLGVRSGAGFSQVLLFVLYWTVLLPFGILASRSKERAAVHELDAEAKSAPASQY